MLSNFLSFVLFAMDPMDQLDAHARSSFRLDATDTFIVLGAAAVLIGLIVLWAVFLRRPPSEKHGAAGLHSFSNRRSKSSRGSSSRSRPSDSSMRSGPGERSGSNSRPGSDRGEVPVRPRRAEPAGEGSEELSSSGRRMVRRRSSRRRSDSPEPADFAAADPKRIKVRKRRRRHHPDNYPRNPTLGETGGLPPVRPDDPEPEPGDNSHKTTD